MAVSSVSVIVFRGNGDEVLFHQRRDVRTWSLPGGLIEEGEPWEEAGIREVFEETGYRVRIERLVGRYRRPQMPGGGDLKIACVGVVTGGEPIAGGPETLRVKWFAVDALPTSLPGYMAEYIRDAREEHPEPIAKVQRFTIWQIIGIRILFGLRRVKGLLRRGAGARSG